jgi:hypothetical protein
VTTLRRLLVGFGVTLFGATAGTASFAATPLALSVVAWVQSVDASPDWVARMRGLSVDEAGSGLTIGSLVIAAENGGIGLEIDDAVLTGYREGSDGGFVASSLRIAKATVKTPGMEVVLDASKFDGIGVPSLASIVYDKSKPFTSLIGVYSAIAKMYLAGGHVDNITFLEKFEDVTSKITYDDVVVGPLDDARIESLSAGPLKVESPAPNPLVELTVGRAQATGIDIDAILQVYDPLRYIAGTGDGIWHRAIGNVAYSDIALTLPGTGLTLGSVSVDDFKVRQPPESFAPLLDAMSGDSHISPAAMDTLSSRYLAGLLSAYGVGRFAIDGVDLRAVGIDQLAFNRFSLSNASSDGFSEMAIEGFVGAIAGQGAVAVDRFALGDVIAPPPEKLIAAFDELQRGADVDVSALGAKLGSLEAGGIDIQAIDFPGASLGDLRADFGNYVGSVPTEIAVRLDNLDVATSSLHPDRARNLIASLGYDRVRANANFNIDWHESDGTLSLDDFHLNIEDFGNTTANIVLAGLTRAAIEKSDRPSDFLGDLLFDRASVTFEDKSVVERSLSMRAELLKVPLDRLKQQLAGALPLMLAFLGNPEKVKEIVPVLQNFIKTPGTLTIKAEPEPPVPVAAIEDAARSRPQSLPGMLGITITGEPGASGGAAPDGAVSENGGSTEGPPTIRKTIEPENRTGTTGSTGPTPAAPP